MTEIAQYMNALGTRAKAAARQIGRASSGDKNAALMAIAEVIEASVPALIAANEKDLVAGKAKGLDSAFLDRLELNAARIAGMVEGVRQIVAR